MIASQKIGKSFMGALNYNLKKLDHPDPKKRADLLDSNFSSMDVKLIKQEIDLIKSLKPNLGRYVYHTSLNFSKEDQLDNNKLLTIAHDYLRESGYTNNQYMIFRHHDADHPHIHLLVNRITFDGEVVSDSNNYKKSEAILRKLEQLYSLTAVQPSSKVAQKAVTKDELEMVLRTGKASEKMVLQELMKGLLKQRNLDIKILIRQGEQAGINFLFNQASTGRVTGITYFHNGFKIKGQALGNQFKWAEIIKKIEYKQNRDRETISQANSRTTAKYGQQTATGEYTAASWQPGTGSNVVPSDLTTGSPELGGDERAIGGGLVTDEELGNPAGRTEERTWKAGQDADLSDHRPIDREYGGFGHNFGNEISDDVDDEAIHGRNRHRERKARTNRR
ncbi:hypothetical protein A0256_15490 [Mucilaginibacter sp. PAMC 26640]|nr:hypothetical protein A0256_15490 [Mucilaginibacter sp. PAMC 26640]